MTAALPVFETRSAYEAAIHRAEPWVVALEAIGARSSLDVISELSVMTCCRSPVLGSRDHVVKIYSRDWSDTHAKYLDEVAAYAVLARDPGLAVPRLVGRASLDGRADYLVLSRIPGRRLDHIMADLSAGELRALAAWTGRYVRRLHRLPLTAEERHDGHAALVRSLDRTRVLERLAEGQTLPRHLLAQVGSWLPKTDDLAGTARTGTFLHFGLKPKHVIVQREGGRWVGSGVVDFNKLTVGPPLAELPRFWHVVRTWPRASVDAFMAESGFLDDAATVADLARRILAWALVQRQSRAWSIDGMEDIASLDELAALAFGRVIEGG